ncbi:MAG: zf-HC2 domain-containing protein [Planctomycetota bacterium]|jgi:outer membrane lipoprotein-sorting protein
MNCAECKELLVGHIEKILEDSQKEAVESHLEICPPCRAELAQITTLHDRLRANCRTLAQRNLENVVLDRILQEQSLKLRKAVKLDSKLMLWRITMKSRIAKLTIAAVIVIGVFVGFEIFSSGKVSAAQVFAEAAEAMSNLRSVYIKAQMRTLPHDNFELILLDREFVPVEIWKEYGTGDGRWRIEKPGRVIVMDGQFSLMLIRPNYAVRAGVQTGLVHWLRPLLDVDKVLDSEIRLAQEQSCELLLTREQGADGANKLVVTVEALAQGDFTNDWLKNKSIPESDNCRIYRFDAQTKLLESLKVYVHTDEDDENDVLVFEITDIEYNLEIDPALFALELPDDVIWYERPKALEDNEKYQQMTPKEMATAFFRACAEQDWDEAAKFWKSGIANESVRKGLGGLEIISIGEPFQSGLYRGWFVPYEVRYKSGRVWKFNGRAGLARPFLFGSATGICFLRGFCWTRSRKWSFFIPRSMGQLSYK